MLTKEKQQDILTCKKKINAINIELSKSTLTPYQYRHKFLESVCYKNKLKKLKV